MSALTKTGRNDISYPPATPEKTSTLESESAQSSSGAFQTEHHPGGSLQQVEPDSSRSASTFSTSSTSRSHPSELTDHEISSLPQEEEYKNQVTRNSISSTISRLFSKFISYFAFPKSIAAQKEEAIANVLDGTATKNRVADLLKKESTMVTDNWASQRADELIREAYAKRAFETFDKIKKEDNSPSLKHQLKSDLMNAMPRLDIDEVDDAQKKDELAFLIAGFLLDKAVPDKHTADLKKEILQDKWPSELLNDSRVSSHLKQLSNIEN